jgi:hypothetical protein
VRAQEVDVMIPAGFPAVAPIATLADLFGPLAPVAALAALAALAVLITLAAGESWMSARRRRRPRVAGPAAVRPGSVSLRPAT